MITVVKEMTRSGIIRRAVSRDGWSVHQKASDVLEYSDARGAFSIRCEVGGGDIDIMVFLSDVASEMSDRWREPKETAMAVMRARLQEALQALGWNPDFY